MPDYIYFQKNRINAASDVSQEYADLLKDSRIPQEWKESAIEYRQVREPSV